MFTGRMIDELIETVERAEEHTRRDQSLEEETLTYYYALAQQEMHQLQLAGVA